MREEESEMRYLRKTLLLASLLFTLFGVALVSGCGNSSGGPDPVTPSDYTGTYTGNYILSGGTDAGQSGVFRLAVNHSFATGSSTSADGNSSTFTGVINVDSGNFTLSGAGTVTGQMIRNGTLVTGTVTLVLANGSSATFSIS
jgi:hypothetical protein